MADLANFKLGLIDKRVSRREFKNIDLTEELKQKITSLVTQMNENGGLESQVVFNADGDDFPTYGRFINPRNYIKMLCDESLEDYNFKIGYHGQKLVLKLVEMGLGTCWAGISFSRVKAQIPVGKRLRAVIMFGFVDDEMSDFEKYIMSSTSVVSRDVKCFYHPKETVPEIFLEGIKAVSRAPSAMNRQPVNFIFNDKKALAYVEKPDTLQGIGLGIAVKHFEIGSNGEIPVEIIDFPSEIDLLRC